MTREPILTADLLHDVFEDLARLAVSEGKVIDVAIYGGAALTLVSNFRISTRDVDAVADDDGQRTIERLAGIIAERRGWTADWLNDQVFPFLSDRVDDLDPAHHIFFRSYPTEVQPGLRVFVPTPEYLLAMKLMAMRIGKGEDDKDLDDILNLLEIVGLTEQTETLEFAAQFFPEAAVSDKVRRGIDEIFRLRGDSTHVLAARYLGRGGPPG